MMIRWLLLALLVVVTGLPVSDASAQNPEVAEGRAYELFQRAESYLRQAHERRELGEKDAALAAYEAAADSYREAYEYFADPYFLYNIAQIHRICSELTGSVIKHQQAIAAYQTYLHIESSGSAADIARIFLVELTGTIRQPNTPYVPVSALAPHIPPPLPITVHPVRYVPGITTPPVHRLSNTLRVTSTAGAAVSLVSLSIGVKFGLDARNAYAKISRHSPEEPWGEEDRRIIANGARAERNMWLAIGIGGAAALAVGGLYHYERQLRKRHRLSWNVVSHKNGAAAAVAIEFH